MARSLLRDIRTITADYEEQQKIDVFDETNTKELKEI